MDTLFDERGAQYKVPIYCTSNPVELVGESPGGGVTPSLNGNDYTTPSSNNNSMNNLNSSSSLNNYNQSPSVPTAVSVSAESNRSSPVKATSVKVVDGKPLNLKIRINPGG